MKKKESLLILLFAVAAVVVGVFAFWKTKGGSSETTRKGKIKIGVAAPLSGENSPYGIPTMKAVNLVAAKFNAADGLLGRQVEVLAEDDVCSAEVAVNAATRLIAQEVSAVVGHVCSAAVISTLSVYENAKILTVSPSATNPKLTQGNNIFFRTIAPDNAQAQTAATFALNTLKPKKIAILHDKGDYGQGYGEYFRSFIEKDGSAEVAIFMGINPKAADISVPVSRIVDSGAELVIWGGYMDGASKLLHQLSKKNVDVDFMSGDGLKSNSFIELTGKLSEGIYVSGPRDTSQNPMAIEAARESVEQYKEEPGAFFNEGYSAALAIFNAIEKAGTTDYEAVRSALVDSKLETPLGLIGFNEAGEVIGAGFSVYRVENSQFVEQA